MKAPTYHEFNGRRYCAEPVLYQLDYALWGRGVAKLDDLVADIFPGSLKTPSRASHASATMRHLVASRRAERIGHGVYRHLHSPFA